MTPDQTRIHNALSKQWTIPSEAGELTVTQEPIVDPDSYDHGGLRVEMSIEHDGRRYALHHVVQREVLQMDRDGRQALAAVGRFLQQATHHLVAVVQRDGRTESKGYFVHDKRDLYGG